MISASRPQSLKDEIIELAKLGNRPKEIAKKFEKSCHYNYVANVVAEARRNGEAIPVFRHRSGEVPKPLPQEGAPQRKALPPAALDYFELRALKKLLGADLIEIEGAADAEAKSLADYVREALIAHVRVLRG
jgi:hypothetical protein